MLFWIAALLLSLCAGALLARPLLLRRGAGTQGANPDVALYKAQLDEIARDVERGVLSPAAAEDARAEIARRLIAADAAAPETVAAGPGRAAALAIVAALVVVAGGTYLAIGAPGEADQPLAARLALAAEIRAARPSQEALEAATPPGPPVEAPEDYRASVAQLRELVPTRPDEAEGWRLLAYHEAQLGNFGAAARAQAQLIGLQGEDAPTEMLAQLMELMTFATNGIVSPEAEMVARRVLDRDAAHVGARFWIGAMHDQTGRPDLAYAFWRPIVESGQDSFHAALARDRIGEAAARAGVDYTPPETRGPRAADVAAAEEMSEADRAAMIEGMVAQLGDRLAREGGPPADWARLIASLGVLGETGRARAIWDEARQVFAADPGALDVLREAAVQAGVAE